MLELNEGKSVASFVDAVFTCTVILLMSTLCFSPMESSYCKKEKKNILVRKKIVSCLLCMYGTMHHSLRLGKNNAELFFMEIKPICPCYYSSENSD